jgi:hypothetical protein
MSLGWGLRGSIGGGSLGAMIPGGMIGLVLCLSERRSTMQRRILGQSGIEVSALGYGCMGLEGVEELSHQHVIGYLPSQGTDGTFRRVSVGVLQPRVGVA